MDTKTKPIKRDRRVVIVTRLTQPVATAFQAFKDGQYAKLTDSATAERLIIEALIQHGFLAEPGRAAMEQEQGAGL